MMASDEIPDHLRALAIAERLVDNYLARRGVTHGAFRDRVVDLVAREVRRRGIAESSRMVELVAAEEARHRANRVDDEVDEYIAAHGSRGRVTPTMPGPVGAQ
jgi:hypothetical protein